MPKGNGCLRRNHTIEVDHGTEIHVLDALRQVSALACSGNHHEDLSEGAGAAPGIELKELDRLVGHKVVVIEREEKLSRDGIEKQHVKVRRDSGGGEIERIIPLERDSSAVGEGKILGDVQTAGGVKIVETTRSIDGSRNCAQVHAQRCRRNAASDRIGNNTQVGSIALLGLVAGG